VHLQEIDRNVETMRLLLQVTGQPIAYEFVEGGLKFGEGEHVIRNEDELVLLRAGLLLRETVEGDDDAPEDYS